MNIFKIIIFATFFFCQNSFANFSAFSTDDNIKSAKIRLVSSKNKLAVEIIVDKNWKIYAKNSAGIGLPPKVDLYDKNGKIDSKILFPKAIEKTEKIGNEIFNYEIYENEVILPIEIKNFDANAKKINYKISFGICKDICVPLDFKGEFEIDNSLDFEAEKYFTTKTKVEKNQPNIIFILIFAFLGGAILNIMPCIFPVLAIKILSIIKQQNYDIKTIRYSFLSTIAGILAVFLILAFFAILIHFTGNIFNWGLQFQNHYFLIFLILILTILTANILDLYSFKQNIFFSNLINKKIENIKNQSIFLPNFLSGILSVMLATPCSAPFLGSAISFAISQNTQMIFLIFIIIGIGFSLPYLLLLASPGLLKYLPKPGKWMIKVKKLMAGFLILTIIWLIFILTNSPSSQYQQDVSVDKKIWQKFDEKKLQELVSQGNIVVVDVTANWCLTCKFNKIRVFDDKMIIDKFKNDSIIAMQADISSPNKDVMKFINRYNRYAIPFDAVFGPGSAQGALASEFLTKKELLNLIEKSK